MTAFSSASNGSHGDSGRRATVTPAVELELISPSASPEEAAAIVAALERFMRATARPRGGPAPDAADPWSRAAILEGVERGSQTDLRDPWMHD